eukprot:2207329-Rhodomonas_salina.1
MHACTHEVARTHTNARMYPHRAVPWRNPGEGGTGAIGGRKLGFKGRQEAGMRCERERSERASE